MNKLKVLTVVGTRPEIIRLSRVLIALDKTESIDHILVHTGQNYDYELNEVFFKDLGLSKPDHFLNAAGHNATTTSGQILINIDPVLEEVKPDSFLVLGDTNSCLGAIAAKKRKIPIFHMEAGNRCFDQRVPEETNRKIVDHIADVNLTYSDIAREYLLKEGFPADRIIKTGSPIYEVIQAYQKQIESSDILDRLELTKENYFLVSAHREENINSNNFIKLVETLNTIAEVYKIPVIVSTHPRTRNRINKTGAKFNSLVKLMKPLGFHDYNNLQKNSKAVLSDSGTISEESSILNFPALNIREAHERPEAMEEASVMMVGLNPERIMQALKVLETQKRGQERLLRQVYFGSQLIELTNLDVTKKNIFLEIGHGYGLLPRLLKNNFKNSKFILVDLPEVNILSYYYLQKTFPNTKILCSSDIINQETIDKKLIDKYDFLILNQRDLKKIEDNFVDCTINIASLGEMDNETQLFYINQIKRVTNNYFYSVNRFRKDNKLFEELNGYYDFNLAEVWDKIYYDFSPTLHIEALLKKTDREKNYE